MKFVVGYFRKKTKSAWLLISLFVQNIYFSADLAKVQTLQRADLTVRGLKWTDFLKFRKALKELNHNHVSILNMLLYFVAGEKYVFIAVKSGKRENQIIGVDLYYRNRRDFQEKTIHEGFIGVVDEARGKGVATSLRKAAIRNFSASKELEGISSRISLNNYSSLASAQNLGFSIVEQYFDDDAGEERYYLVCPLEGRK